MRDLLKRLFRRLPAPPSTNYLFRDFKVNPYASLPAGALILDIGSKEARGRYTFGEPPADATVLCLDLCPGEGVDIVADAHDMHVIAEGSVDCVVCISVLEHVRYPQRVVAEILRILKPGGVFYLNVPFVFPYHADPDDYYRFSFRGVEILCEQFERLDSGFNRGPASTMHHLLVHFLAIVFCFNSSALYSFLQYVFRWLLFWVKYLDAIVAKYDMAKVIHAGSYFIGRKPGSPQS